MIDSAYVPLGDIISLEATTLSSIRSIQRGLPLLKEYGSFETGSRGALACAAIIPHLEILRGELDKKFEA